MMENMPLVSVIVPTYNRALLISEAIQSVQDQTYTRWELIIVDDGSTDETENVIKGVADHRIRYFKINHSGSFAAVRNHGVKQSEGEFIAFLDSDDLWHPVKLREQTDLFARSPESMFVFTHVEFFGSNAHPVDAYPSITAEHLLARYFEEGHFVFYPSSLMFRRSVLSRLPGLNEALPKSADTEFFARLCANHQGSFLGTALVRIRKHQSNTSAASPLFGYPESISLATTFYRGGYLNSGLFKRFVSRIHYKMGLIQTRQGAYRQAMKCFLQYCRYKPLDWKGWARMLQLGWQGMASTLRNK